MEICLNMYRLSLLESRAAIGKPFEKDWRGYPLRYSQFVIE